ncbi:MAG: 6-bladed beta-propeller [Bacteroidetes bacterium]|jgi:hypothetical protein|nr:6-bladed beta-propeller [Bacteroidota bacterium]MBT3748393.1 6-bladed beta-propeller [Bacteroidota bacterium]MBT4400383.1 6-bladed beta-propeller [Bacteroidota bacterium]MBT4410598.1 6-bladed beta-propeller [Bacteroidota bacterium]MBT5425001.1 6-bladed beta-propeller [Bacteroidota bacterium]
MKRTSYLSLFIMLVLFACSGKNQNQDTNADSIINIDVLQAFDQQKSMKLSDLVKEVEFVQFDASPEAYFMNARSMTIGKKYIMIADDGENRVLLFDRHGKFIRQIGQRGKGPGEYSNPWQAAMDPNEKFIIIADGMVQKIAKFTVEGAFVKEIKSTDVLVNRIIDEVRFINDEQFVLIMRRPSRPVDGFASLPLFDMDLNLVKGILPRANDENLSLFTNPNGVFGIDKKRMTFWEPYLDTMYTITPDGEAIPTHKIGFSKGGPTKEYVTTATYGRSDNLKPKNSLFGIHEFGDYFQFSGRRNGDWFQAFYNQKSGDFFELSNRVSCDTSGTFKSACLENDLFGVEPISMREYHPGLDRVIGWSRPAWVGSHYDLDCIRNKKVKYPKLRDQYLAIAEDIEAAEQMLLVLMKLK